MVVYVLITYCAMKISPKNIQKGRLKLKRQGDFFGYNLKP